MAAGELLIFGVAGMALAGMAIYGLVSHTGQTEHPRDRHSNGAQGTQVVWHFMRCGLRLGVMGAVVGTVAALVLTGSSTCYFARPSYPCADIGIE